MAVLLLKPLNRSRPGVAMAVVEVLCIRPLYLWEQNILRHFFIDVENEVFEFDGQEVIFDNCVNQLSVKAPGGV